MAAKAEPRFKIVSENRKARFNYEIGEKFEAGIALLGTEVKASEAKASGGLPGLPNICIPAACLPCGRTILRTMRSTRRWPAPSLPLPRMS